MVRDCGGAKPDAAERRRGFGTLVAADWKLVYKFIRDEPPISAVSLTAT